MLLCSNTAQSQLVQTESVKTDYFNKNLSSTAFRQYFNFFSLVLKKV